MSMFDQPMPLAKLTPPFIKRELGLGALPYPVPPSFESVVALIIQMSPKDADKLAMWFAR